MSYLSNSPRRKSHTDLNKVFPTGFPLHDRALDITYIEEDVKVDPLRRGLHVETVVEEELQPLPPFGKLLLW